MLQTIRQTISRYDMFSPGDTVVVAVSGGPDSIALLHALWTMRKELQISFSVAHLNHGIRGRQADEDASFVKEFAQTLKLPVTVEKVDLKELKAKSKLSLQETAREVRYDFLRRLADAVGGNNIATAHTADDQAETVLLNIIRGSGIDGLVGIPAVRGQIVRPLIEVFRSSIIDYLDSNSLPYRTDPTNLSPTYMRNRVRLELIPLIESRFNKRAKKAILSLSKVARVESEFVRGEAEKAYDLLATAGPDEVKFEADALLALHESLTRRVLRMAIERVKGNLRDIELRQVEKALKHVREGRRFCLTLPSGDVRIEFQAGFLRVFRSLPPQTPAAFEHVLPVPGVVSITEIGLVISAELAPPPQEFPKVGSGAVLDASKLRGRLVARNWRWGDRMVPLGMSGHKKLHDMFVDAKIPRPQRRLIPIIGDEEKIIWVPGLAVSEHGKVDHATRQVLKLSLHKLEEAPA